MANTTTATPRQFVGELEIEGRGAFFNVWKDEDQGGQTIGKLCISNFSSDMARLAEYLQVTTWEVWFTTSASDLDRLAAIVHSH